MTYEETKLSVIIVNYNVKYFWSNASILSVPP